MVNLCTKYGERGHPKATCCSSISKPRERKQSSAKTMTEANVIRDQVLSRHFRESSKRKIWIHISCDTLSHPHSIDAELAICGKDFLPETLEVLTSLQLTLCKILE